MSWRRRRLQKRVDSVPFWWHSIELPGGLVTPGANELEDLRREWAALRLQELEGTSVLDIGAWDGFFSFEAERRGARRVVALDHYVWALDLEAQQRYWTECRDRDVAPEPYHEVQGLWQPRKLPGKRGFDVARRALGSGVEPVVGDFMEIDLQRLGEFDVVFFLGVLYHLEDPIRALRRLAEVTGGLAVISTQAVFCPSLEDRAIWESYPGAELNHDVSNWWAPNLRALHDLCRSVGFCDVDTVVGPPAPVLASEGPLQRYRATVHAYT